MSRIIITCAISLSTPPGANKTYQATMCVCAINTMRNGTGSRDREKHVDVDASKHESIYEDIPLLETFSVYAWNWIAQGIIIQKSARKDISRHRQDRRKTSSSLYWFSRNFYLVRTTGVPFFVFSFLFLTLSNFTFNHTRTRIPSHPPITHSPRPHSLNHTPQLTTHNYNYHKQEKNDPSEQRACQGHIHRRATHSRPQQCKHACTPLYF